MDFMEFWKALNDYSAKNGVREATYSEARDLYEDAERNVNAAAIAVLAGMHKGRVEAEAYAAH